MSYESLAQMVNFNFWFTYSVNSTSKELVGIIEKIGDLAKTLELVDQAEQYGVQTEGVETPEIHGNIDFRQLDYVLPGGKVRIRGNTDNTIIKKGEVIALVGYLAYY
jgi:ABC-type bacteriocin/lantibiotic exporter with double-glycine peptidase domain